MKTRVLAAWITVALAVFGNMLSSGAAHAADAPTTGLNITTSPLPISLVAKPGTTVSTDLKVKNTGAQTEVLKVGLLKFGAYGDEGKPELLDFAPTDDYAHWVTFSQNTFTAEPNVWKTVKMTIHLPKSAAFGYYYAPTFSRAASERASGARTNTLKGSTAILVLLNADVPNARREIGVADFVSKKGIYEYLPATFNIRLHNSGNVHLAPSGNIFITKGKDRQVGVLNVNNDLGNILPNSNRIFKASWSDGFPHYVQKTVDGKPQVDNRSDPVMKLDWNFNDINKIRFGKYTAHLTMAYDNGKRDVPIEAQVSFWVIPWRAILILAAIAALVLAGVWTSLGGVRRRLGLGQGRDRRGRWARKR